MNFKSCFIYYKEIDIFWKTFYNAKTQNLKFNFEQKQKSKKCMYVAGK